MAPTQHSPGSTDAAPGLFHVSLNPTAQQTIVLLHGIFCSHLEFALVAPHLPDYHLLLVDMPAHSRSQHITPFTPVDSATHLASLIQAHAHNGQAHVVGLSAGGFVGLQLAIQYPDLVSSLWISGATPFRGYQRWLALHPRILYVVLSGFIKWMPDWIYAWMCRKIGMQPHDELRAEIKANFSLGLLRDGYGSIERIKLESTMDTLARTGVKTLTVAGELQDDVPLCLRMSQLLREGGSNACRSAVAKKAVHGWDLQFPELFANSVRAWIEGTDQPEGIEDLS